LSGVFRRSQSPTARASGYGPWRRGDDTRDPCFLTERDALAYTDEARTDLVFAR